MTTQQERLQVFVNSDSFTPGAKVGALEPGSLRNRERTTGQQ